MQLTASTLAYVLYCASVALSAPTAVKRQSGTSYSGGTTANDVQNGVCAPVTFIFARGSTETGNMGSSVGPALAKALISTLGNNGVAIQGVDYSATIESNLSQGADGGPELAKLANQALQNCPNTKIAIAGYSQGATVCHYAVAKGGLSEGSVSSAVLYGDPLFGQAVGSLPASRTKEFCASGDGVCETGGFAITPAHLSYATGPDIGEGAQFIQQNAGSSSGGTTTGGTSPSASAGLPSASGAAPTVPSSSPTSPFGSLPSFPSSTSPFGGLSSSTFTSPFGSLPSFGLGSFGSGAGIFGREGNGSSLFGRLLKRFS